MNDYAVNLTFDRQLLYKVIKQSFIDITEIQHLELELAKETGKFDYVEDLIADLSEIILEACGHTVDKINAMPDPTLEKDKDAGELLSRIYAAMRSILFEMLIFNMDISDRIALIKRKETDYKIYIDKMLNIWTDWVIEGMTDMA